MNLFYVFPFIALDDTDSSDNMAYWNSAYFRFESCLIYISKNNYSLI